MRPSGRTIRFDGLMSRWMTFAACSVASASATPASSRHNARTGGTSRALMSDASDRPSTSVIAKYGRPSTSLAS